MNYALRIHWKKRYHKNFRNYRYRNFRVSKPAALSSNEYRLLILSRFIIMEMTMLILLTPFLMGIVETLMVRS